MITVSMERAGSVLTPWLASCLSCIWPLDDERAHHQPTQDMGVEREMKVCHDQPHLVPPMKLVLYDNLPSPGGPHSRSSTISQWVAEGRTLASKATDRASLSIRRKSTKPSPHRPTISGPSDFRRVSPPQARRQPFRPLELSIYLPGNRLSDLPEFDDFDLETLEAPKPPPKIFSPVEDSFVPHPVPTSPFKVARKPVGSSINSRMEVYDRRRTLPESVLNQAPRISTDENDNGNISTQHARSRSEPLSSLPQTPLLEDKKPPRLPINLKEIHETPSQRSSSTSQTNSTVRKQPPTNLPRPAAHPRKLSSEIKSPRSRKVTQWLFQKSSPVTPNMISRPLPPSTTTNQPIWPSSPHHNPSLIHARTMSASTASSANMSYMTARTPSLSSAITATTVHPPPSIQGTLDKDIESGAAFYMSHSNKSSVPRFDVVEPCPTVYEAEQHQFQFTARPEYRGAVGAAF
ncbi:hypothetical protein FQN52_005812 [Onygenales sp. PD_12]|nr:hypothetical protein FQN52_005812 [Onygenales sp. PD_12]